MTPYERWKTLPPLDYALPLAMPNGSVVEELTVSCNRCGEPHPENDTHGDVVNFGDGYLMRSLSWCPKCSIWGQATTMIVTNGGGFGCEGPRAGAPLPQLWGDDYLLVGKNDPLPDPPIRVSIWQRLKRLIPHPFLAFPGRKE